MTFVCPQCKGQLNENVNYYACAACARCYPILCDIPDFRLHADPYISIEDDHRKGKHLFDASQALSFVELVRYYYSITPEVPSDLAERWIAHILASELIAADLLSLAPAGREGPLLDIGCSTGGLLIAERNSPGALIGVDVAFRWLVIGRARIREAGVAAKLVCANAEALPFPNGYFGAITALDLLEHVRDAELTVREAARVSTEGAWTLCITNNRFAPITDPQAGVWGVGYVPRRWQGRYVEWRRPGMREYLVEMRSARELDRLFRRAQYRCCRTTAAPLSAPHLPGSVFRKLLECYNAMLRISPVQGPFRWVGPRLLTMAER